jgi:putative DNA modification/repair radical SAM protein
MATEGRQVVDLSPVPLGMPRAAAAPATPPAVRVAASLQAKLALLADAAKYDASCASSGTTRRDSRAGGLGSAGGMGICHSYAPDGRCISLLKILLTNYCEFDCKFCINRRSSNVPRARFTADEVVGLTMDFYRRNYIEGLFLSSGIVRSPDYTMQQLCDVARSLREQHGFRGYIHLKTIPDADPALVLEAGRFADRLSINVELPRERSLEALAPQKSARRIERAMGEIGAQIEDNRDARRHYRRAPLFAPAGQSTQMIVGADAAADVEILGRSDALYRTHRLRRVYYSAYSPIPDPSSELPAAPAPLLREHRLYQADWLLRFYDFTLPEISAATHDGMLDLSMDPKTAWALRHPAAFPVDVNRAAREQLLRVPGLGVKSVAKLLRMRRLQRLRLDHLVAVVPSLAKIQPFIVALDWKPRAPATPDAARSVSPTAQLALAL